MELSQALIASLRGRFEAHFLSILAIIPSAIPIVSAKAGSNAGEGRQSHLASFSGSNRGNLGRDMGK